MDNLPEQNAMEETPGYGIDGLDPAELLKQGAAGDTVTENPAGGFTPPTPEELAAFFPQFEILGLIGRGGMGAVYKVRQPELDRIVALKILPPSIDIAETFPERFTREAKAMAKLNHPGIVTIHEFGREGDLYYFLMEYVDGVNLRQLLENSRISPREAMAIVPQICDALQFAHDQGIVHRDIKPENILLDRLGRVKVADFGIAKLVGNADFSPQVAGAGASFTEHGRIMGTPQYMAPEQSESPTEVDHRADIFALGVVFYQMLTGELPEKDLKAPSRKIRIDVRLDEVVLRALEKNPELRYPSATEMRTSIEAVADSAEDSGQEVAASSWRKGYRSEKEIFGLPWIHIAGMEFKDGKQETARGVLAIGGKAQGVLAFGGLASGIFAFGGVAIGLFAFGGLAIGAVSFGGLAIALLLACGGLALGYAAIGGNVFSYFGYGGNVHATHALGPQHSDQLAKEFFLPWAAEVTANLGSILFFLMALVFLISFGVPLWIMQRRAMRETRDIQDPQTPPAKNGKSKNFKVLAVVAVIVLIVIAVPPIAALLLFFSFSQQQSKSGSTVRADRSPQIVSAVSSEPDNFDPTALTSLIEIRLRLDESPLLDDVETTESEILRKIKSEHRRNPDVNVLLKTATDLPYEKVREWMEKLSALGISNIKIAATAELSAAPPQLSRLAWQHEIKADTVAAWLPDGKRDATGREMPPFVGLNFSGKKTETETPRYLCLWFSHPLIDEQSVMNVRLFEDEGETLLNAPVNNSATDQIPASEGIGGNGWITATRCVGTMTDFPAEALVSLRYSVGSWTYTQEIPADFNGTTSLDNTSFTTNPGQDVHGNSFIQITDRVNPELKDEQIDFIAISKDGREIESSGGGLSGTDGAYLKRIDFKIPLREVEIFRCRKRPIQELKQSVVLRPDEATLEVVTAKDLPAGNRLQLRRVVSKETPEAEVMRHISQDENGVETEDALYVSPEVIIWGDMVERNFIMKQDEGVALDIRLNDIGTNRMKAATQPSEKQLRLAIIIDGEITSAPVVQSAPLDRSFQIGGFKSQAEAIDLIKSFPNGKRELKALPAVLWLIGIDERNYEQSHDNASDHFKSKITKARWIEALTAARKTFGTFMGIRNLSSVQDSKSLPGMPDGDYRIVVFTSAFENKREATETVTLIKEGDEWKVAGYFIR